MVVALVVVLVTSGVASGGGNGGSNSGGGNSKGQGHQPPSNTGLPAISGTPVVGQSLSGSAGTWSGPAPSYSYQWLRCDSAGAGCAAVGGATGPGYALVSADAGSSFRFAVTASNQYGSTSATSAATAAVTQPASTPPPPPPPTTTTAPPTTTSTQPPATVSDSLQNGATLSGTYAWTVKTSGDAAAVEFWATPTGQSPVKLGTVQGTSGTYTFNLDTTTLANGGYLFGVVEVDSSGARYADSDRRTATVQNATTTTAPTSGGLYDRWNWSADPSTVKDSVQGDGPFGEQCASTSGARNSGGTTTSPLTPDRATSAQIGGLWWARIRTIDGDSYVSGSGTRYRCDLIMPSSASSHTANGETTAYRQRIMVRPGVDFVPTPNSDGSTMFLAFHRNAGGYPGGSLWSSYAGSPTQTGNSAEFNPSNIKSGTPPFQVGGLFLEMYGGQWLDASGNAVSSTTTTPHTINAEDWQLLPPGWAGQPIDIAYLIHWSANRFDRGEKFYKDWNGGKPTNFTDSGWIEVEYRLGTVSGSSITWGSWQWYDGGTITFNDGGQQVWQNGPVAHRHYRPTLFFYNGSGQYDTPYVKEHNYHEADGSDSSVYVGDLQVGDSLAAVGAPG